MSMNLSWLEDFLALVAYGNFSRAAQDRNMTQPAFSRRIRALEEWLGTELFDRSCQPARLTAAGEWFRGAAQDLMSRLARVPGEARAVAQAHSSTLRFAATHALSFSFMPAWLRDLESSTAVGPVTLASDVLARCEAMLLESQVQFLITHAHPGSASELSAQGFPFVRVGSDQLVPVSAPDAAGHPRFALAQASADRVLPVLGYSAESGLGRVLRDVHGPALERLATQNVFTAHLASVLRTMALDGRGMAWLPQSLIADDLAGGRLVEAAAPAWRIDVEIRVYRDRTPLGPAAEAFWAAVCAAAR